MKKRIVRFYGDAGVENPLGLPAGYPDNSTFIDVYDPVPEGWHEISEEAYENAMSENRSVVDAKLQAERERLEREAAENATPEPDTTIIETQNQIADLQVHVDSVEKGVATNDDRLVAVDTVAALMLKFAPVLEQLLAMQKDQSNP